MTDLVEVRRSLRHAEAEQLALALVAVGIACSLVTGREGASLRVARQDAERARRQLEAYEHENAPARLPPWQESTAGHGLGASLVYAAVLLLVFGAGRRSTWSVDWLALGAAQAGLIQEGAWWRTVTALTLHADHMHLLANLTTGMVFGLLVAQLLGSGLGWLAILLAGALGNALNAFLQAPGHIAVGASTALFGALGLLSGYGRRSQVVPWRGGLHRWAPLSAGIMLVVLLGIGGERTDVGAHVAGFVVGGVLGLALAHHAGHVPQGRRAQGLYGLLACGLLLLAWLLALSSRGQG